MFLYAGMILCLVLYPLVTEGGPYSNSSHGNTNYGVKRNGTFQYTTGLCAHCHEQHASIDAIEPDPLSGSPSRFVLFYAGHVSQTDNFCYKCHDSTFVIPATAIINRSYSYRAGGWTNDTVNDVLEAFSTPPNISSHSLEDIRTFITGRWGYAADSNPCCACHNPHAAQGDPANSGNTPKTSFTRGYAVSRPSQHDPLLTWGLWGSSAGQKMADYVGARTYQAPYRYNTAAAYEPDGSLTTDGSNLTDYVTFCTDCHNATNTIYSTSLGRNLYKFDWNTEQHGKGIPALRPGFQNLLPPFQDAQMGNHVLSCTDCHEAHGSPNNYLIRKEVNGAATVVVTEDGVPDKEWMKLCERCHANLNGGSHVHPSSMLGEDCSTLCHPMDGGHMYANCKDCHFHGNSQIGGVPYGNPLF